MSDVIYTLDIAKDCPVTKAKITISTLHNNGKTANKLWTYRLDKPCQHFVLGPLLVNAFNLNNRCRINKGHYEIHVNMDELSTKFLGSSFFYGSYAFKVMAFNAENNFFCQSSVMVIKKS
ncbi:uncharacterized protein [Epargyreus clarus]|uniref:uncharacterized protein n=1 Tax=Epargyreus clarus TaxID=520877 RepID=UPI003C2F433A